MIEGTSENFEKEVLQSDVPVLVDFNASWCPPCQALHPILKELASSAIDFKIINVDIDAEPTLSAEYDVSSIPCLVFFRDGKEYERRVGLQPRKRILKILGAK